MNGWMPMHSYPCEQLAILLHNNTSMLFSDIHDFGILRCCHILTVTIFYFSSFAFTHHFVCLVNPAHAEFLVGR
jgi:hypothetical protein